MKRIPDNATRKLISPTTRARWDALAAEKQRCEKRARDGRLSRRRGDTTIRRTIKLERLKHIKTRYEKETPSPEDEARIVSLVAAYLADARVPPVRVLSRSEGLCMRGSHLLDGHHRLTAARRAGLETIAITLVI